MKVTIETIPHADQRYPTAGDWFFEGSGDLVIRVSDMGNWKYEALVAFHELAEVLLCKSRGVVTAQADAFDMAFTGEGEPGDDPSCPYRREHFFATNVERLLADQIGVDWQEYDSAIEALWPA